MEIDGLLSPTLHLPQPKWGANSTNSCWRSHPSDTHLLQQSKGRYRVHHSAYLGARFRQRHEGGLWAQVSYGGVDYPPHGSTGYPALLSSPTATLSFSPGEQITGVNGTYDTYRLTSLAFRTSRGRILGPYASISGTGWVFRGVVYSFFGATTSVNQVVGLANLGFWYPAPPPPPAPPARPPPPAAPRPSGPPAWNWGRVQTYIYGYTGQVTFNDGPFYTGERLLSCGMSRFVLCGGFLCLVLCVLCVAVDKIGYRLEFWPFTSPEATRAGLHLPR
jgi:hypothetical protein